jgi:micrococcal nuclease
MIIDQLFHYMATVDEVYDGDTCTVAIDLGMHTWIHGEKLRLNRINAPELRGPTRPAGELSRDFLRTQILGKTVLLETIKDQKEKFGRYLAEIWLHQADGSWINVNDLMVAKGFAIYQSY